MKTDIHFWLHLAQMWMRNVSDGICSEDQNIHFIFNNFFFENRAVYEVIWKNIVERGRTQQMTIWRMRIAWRIPKVTHTIRKTYCCSTAPIVARTRLNVFLNVHCLSLFKTCYKFTHSLSHLSKWMSVPLNRLLRLLSSCFYFLCTNAVCTDGHSVHHRPFAPC
jgi:hypothetical protein